jgi:hypothetical protein
MHALFSVKGLVILSVVTKSEGVHRTKFEGRGASMLNKVRPSGWCPTAVTG